MATLERWHTAQAYERGYWDAVSGQITQGERTRMGFYDWRARQLQAHLAELGMEHVAGGDSRVLEVGSGPVGLLTFLRASERVSVDPLEDFYASRPDLIALRDPGVRYLTGVGESLPVPTGHFDLVIIENCIDHVRDMDRVMQELRRAMRPGGVLYLTVNARTLWGYVVHRALSRLRLDPGHPHTVTRRSAVRLVGRNGFDVQRASASPFLAAWRQDLRGPSARARLKAALGVSEVLVTVFATKTPGDPT